MLGSLLTAPFKVVSGTLDGVAKAVDNIANAHDRDHGEVSKTIFTAGLADVVEGTFKGTKRAIDDIANSDKKEDKDD